MESRDQRIDARIARNIFNWYWNCLNQYLLAASFKNLRNTSKYTALKKLKWRHFFEEKRMHYLSNLLSHDVGLPDFINSRVAFKSLAFEQLDRLSWNVLSTSVVRVSSSVDWTGHNVGCSYKISAYCINLELKHRL